jgi:hypothetical protein
LTNTDLIIKALVEATENATGDYAVKLASSSLLLEIFMIDPDLISAEAPGLAGLSQKGSIMDLV